jgi:hypothetical protein
MEGRVDTDRSAQIATPAQANVQPLWAARRWIVKVMMTSS